MVGKKQLNNIIDSIKLSFLIANKEKLLVAKITLVKRFVFNV
jgi:hypothetical protein